MYLNGQISHLLSLHLTFTHQNKTKACDTLIAFKEWLSYPQPTTSPDQPQWLSVLPEPDVECVIARYNYKVPIDLVESVQVRL